MSLENLPFPNKKYNIIYADPPWKYTSKSVAPNRWVTNHYPTLNLNEIINLNIKDLTDKNCYLFLWVTSPHLSVGIETLHKWGFSYKTVAFCWVKTNKDGSCFMGLGGYTRANIELCLLGVKGKLKRLNRGVRQVVISQREEHSKKPDIVRKRIELLFGDLPRIELFAREKTPGWDVWGNEI